jgi:hypothetical protein
MTDSPIAGKGAAGAAAAMFRTAVTTTMGLVPRTLVPGGGAGAPPAADGTEPRRIKPEESRISLVAELLLKENFYLAALELHQELIERARGPHPVQCLNQFFGDPDKLESIIEHEVTSDASVSATLAGAFCACVDRAFRALPRICMFFRAIARQDARFRAALVGVPASWRLNDGCVCVQRCRRYRRRSTPAAASVSSRSVTKRTRCCSTACGAWRRTSSRCSSSSGASAGNFASVDRAASFAAVAALQQ